MRILMNSQLAVVPETFTHAGVGWKTISIMENIYTRALPLGGGNPRWFSNDEISTLVVSN